MKLTTPDKRMLQLPDILKDAGIINFKYEFLKTLSMPRQNIFNIKAGTQHFTVKHIEKVCKKYMIDANWIFGLQHDRIFQSVDRILPKRKLVRKRAPTLV